MASFLEILQQTSPIEQWPLVRNWMMDEPQALFAELRTHRPVLKLPELVIVTRFNDCLAVLRQYNIFSVALYKPKQGNYWMAQDDTAVHCREKSIMRSILDIEELPRIRSYVAKKTALFLQKANGNIDAVNGIARAVPIALVQDWFGYDQSDPKDLFEWSYWNQYDAFHNQPFDSIFVKNPSKITANREAAREQLGKYLATLVSRRAKELKSGQVNTDLVTRLLKLSLSGSLNFDAARVAMNVGGLLIGTVETTSHAVINVLAVLFDRPKILAEARAVAESGDTTAFDSYVLEALRFKPAFPYFFRTCERSTQLAVDTDYASTIDPETTVLAVTHSAMFDAAAFPEPEKFNPNRSETNTFTFGQGIHECLGRYIGRVMIAEIVRQILVLPNLRPAGPIDKKGGPVPEYYPLQWSKQSTICNYD